MKQATNQTQRELPEDPNELDAAVRPYKVLVRPVVQGMSRLSEALGAEKFDSAEIEGGVLAFASLAYQERAEVNAWWLVGVWSVSVSAPRIIDSWSRYEEKKAAREKEPARLVEAVASKAEKEPAPVVDLSA